MNAHTPTDLLTQAIGIALAEVQRTSPITQRARMFWAAVSAARDLAANDIIEADFLQLAADTGLQGDLGQDTVEHLIRWGLAGRDPFGRLS
jgi:hypothetical protein